MKQLEQLKGLKDLVQDAIDKGASSVEEVHKDIAARPFSVLEQIIPLEAPVKGVREIQQATIGNVYEMIRLVNRTTGEIAGEILEKIDDAAPGDEDE